MVISNWNEGRRSQIIRPRNLLAPRYCTQPLLPYFQHVFHASEFAVSLTVGTVTLAVALTAPFIGMFAEVIVPALFCMAATTLIAATATSLPGCGYPRFERPRVKATWSR